MKHFTQHTSQLTIGLDLGDKLSEVCVLDSEHRIIKRGSLPTDPKTFEEFFGSYPGATAVFEVGSQSRWVQPLVRKAGLGKVITADPRQIKLITQSTKKTDRRDAFILARAGQGMPELLCPVEHRSEEAHADLSVMRTREMLVAQRTDLVNRIRGMVKASGHKQPSCTAAYFFSQAKPQIPTHLHQAAAPLLAVLKVIHEQLLEIKRSAKQMVKEKYPVVDLLMTIPSVGLVTALTFVLTIEHSHRIRGTRNVGAYLGLTPRRKESGSARPQLGITKAGDTHLRRLLVLCAHHLLSRGKDCRLKRWGLEICKRGGSNAKKRAVVATARKLSIHMLAIWKSGETYDLMRGIPESELPELITMND